MPGHETIDETPKNHLEIATRARKSPTHKSVFRPVIRWHGPQRAQKQQHD